MARIALVSTGRRRFLPIPLLVLSLFSFLTPSLSAQQLPNNGFEGEWADCIPWTPSADTKATGKTPASWTISNVYALGGMAAAEVGKSVAGNKSTNAVQLEAQSQFGGNVVPAYISLGTTWSTSKLNGTTPTEKDGGSFGGIDFTYRPDAISFDYKRSHGDKNPSEVASVVVYSWKGTYTQADVPASIGTAPATTTMTDRDRNIIGIATARGGEITASDDAELISFLDATIEGDKTGWTKATYAIPYKSDAAPEKINVIFSANNYWDDQNIGAKNTLVIDNVALIYFSRLSGVTIDGNAIADFDKDTYSYSYDGYLSDIEAVECEKYGEGKSATVEWTKDADKDQVIITVTGVDADEDGRTSHTYTIQCAKPVTGLAFPAGLATTMQTGDKLTIAAADFIFTPADAAQQTIASLTMTATNEGDATLAEADGVYTLTAVNPTTVTLTAVSANGVTATHEITVEARPLTAMSFKRSIYGLTPGDNLTLTAADIIFEPADAYNKGIELSVTGAEAPLATVSDDKTTVTIDAMQDASFTVTATSTDDATVTATATVTISSENIYPTGIELKQGTVLPSALYIGEEASAITIPVVITPEGYNVAVTTAWSSDNSGVSVNDNGTITIAADAEPADAVTIIATAAYTDADGAEASVDKTFTLQLRQPATAVAWTDSEGNTISRLSLKQGRSATVAASVIPANATDKSVEYEVVSDGAISFDSATGVITATAPGTAAITARATNDAIADNGRTKPAETLTIEVAAMPTKIEVSSTATEYTVGSEYDLTATITPSEAAADAVVTWSSSAPSIVNVDTNGHITALASGTAIITATTDGIDGTVSADIEIEVAPEVKTRQMAGWVVVTDSEGTETILPTTLSYAFTSSSKVTLSIDDVRINGFRIGTVKVPDVSYTSMIDDFDGVPVMMTLSLPEGKVDLMNGAIEATAKIVSSPMVIIENAVFGMPNAADISFDITVTNWDNEKVTVKFSTQEPTPKEPEQPEEPVAPAEPVTMTKYPGTITFAVTPLTNSGDKDPDAKPDTYDVKVMVTVTDRGAKADDGETSIVEIAFPAMRFGEVEYDDWSRASGSDDEYLYSFEPFTLTDVTARRSGATTVYSREQGPVEVTTADGKTVTYHVGLKGSATDAGDARMALSMGNVYDFWGDPVEMEGAYANSEDEGDIYNGKLTIDLAGTPLTEGEGQDATVQIIPDATGNSATFILPDFNLEGIGALGDIRVDDVTVDRDEDGNTFYYGSVNDMELAGGAIKANVELSGTVDAEGNASMSIDVTWEGMPIKVEFNGKRSGATTGIDTPAAEAPEAVGGSAEYFTIGGVRVAAGHLAPGLYIERRGGVARKILVK